MICVQMAFSIVQYALSMLTWLSPPRVCGPQTAQTHLEKALEVAAGAGCSVTDWEIGEHHFKLGRVLWAVGGESRADPEKVRHTAWQHSDCMTSLRRRMHCHCLCRLKMA